MLESGDASGAVPLLAGAVAATHERVSECLEPTGEQCLTYAYALYDLGRALEQSGEERAAAKVLQERIQIDNQRGAVQAELSLVLAQAGTGAPSPPPAGGPFRRGRRGRGPGHRAHPGRRGAADRTNASAGGPGPGRTGGTQADG
jgi:hypothetical protein